MPRQSVDGTGSLRRSAPTPRLIMTEACMPLIAALVVAIGVCSSSGWMLAIRQLRVKIVFSLRHTGLLDPGPLESSATEEWLDQGDTASARFPAGAVCGFPTAGHCLSTIICLASIFPPFTLGLVRGNVVALPLDLGERALWRGAENPDAATALARRRPRRYRDGLQPSARRSAGCRRTAIRADATVT